MQVRDTPIHTKDTHRKIPLEIHLRNTCKLYTLRKYRKWESGNVRLCAKGAAQTPLLDQLGEAGSQAAASAGVLGRATILCQGSHLQRPV